MITRFTAGFLFPEIPMNHAHNQALDAIYAYGRSIGLGELRVCVAPFGAHELDVEVTAAEQGGILRTRSSALIKFRDEPEAMLQKRITTMGRRLAWILKKDMLDLTYEAG